MDVSHFSGCGNDFLIIDERKSVTFFSPTDIQMLCAQARTNGADGFISVRASRAADLAMHYWNKDGRPASMCGNGVRALARFLKEKCGFSHDRFTLEVAGRTLEVAYEGEEVSVDMGPPIILGWDIALPYQGTLWHLSHIDTGVPHLVTFVKDVEAVDVDTIGRFFRHHARFQPEGANVNFVELLSSPASHAAIRTFERGVEAETLACGTGCTAAAVAIHRQLGHPTPVTFRVRSQDQLRVYYDGHTATLRGGATWLKDGILERHQGSYRITFAYVLL